MKRISILCIALFGITACGYDTLYSDLDEQQSNEMLALLMDNGIESRKTRGDGAWQLELKKSDLPPAMDVLRRHGYPRERYETLGQVFKKEGFVSSPLEERARLLHGLSQELSQTLTEIDGVVTARVHLAIPERNALSDTRSPSSASVFIKHHANADVSLKTAAIKALVVNSVEGLPYENVTVSFFATTSASTPRLTRQGLTTSSASQLSRNQLLMTCVVGLLGALGITVSLRRRSRGLVNVPKNRA